MSIHKANDRKSLETAVKQEMEKTIQSLTTALQSVRTGRASTSILDNIHVDSYGSKMKLSNVATLTTPQSNLIVVKPFDAGLSSAIEKSIQIAGLGLNPQNDGKSIRITIPPLSEERRKDIVKQVKKTAEEAKVSLRNHRQEGINHTKHAQDKLSWSKDDAFRATEDIQKLTDSYNKKVDEMYKAKEKEILTL